MDSSGLLLELLTLVRSGHEGGIESRRPISAEVLRSLLSALHFRDSGTLRHCQRVGLLTVGIASRLGWEDQELRTIEIAALLHDLGKIGIPDHILRKPGQLSPDEAEYIAARHRVAVGLLQVCRVHPSILEIIAQSHGLDEADGRSGAAATSLGARILAVADAYDSLTTRQVYRDAFDRIDALQILDEQAGKQFDRNVVAALSRWLDTPEAIELVDMEMLAIASDLDDAGDSETVAASGQLCQIFSYLAMLESLYEAYYIVDRERKVVVWNNGAARLFGHSAGSRLGQSWNRKLMNAGTLTTDSIENAFTSGRPHCHTMTLTDSEGNFRELDIQTIPIVNGHGTVMGIAELLCDRNSSKQNHGQFRKLQLAASRDPLTGVFNRGELERQLAQLFQNWETDSREVFSVIFFDLDHFKSINDRYSHGVGDRVLIDVTRLVQDDLYSGEILGRYGGEEFVILCPETPLEAAIERAERLRRTIMAARVADRDDLRATASFGVAQVESGDDLNTVVKRADEALYDAKREGRNRVCRRGSRKPAVAENNARKPAKGWVHQTRLHIRLADDMLPLKLRGFVDEYAAQIVHVSSTRVVLTVGVNNLFGVWGRTQQRQPVQVTLELQDHSGSGASSHRRIPVDVLVEPVGRAPGHEQFESRAVFVVEALRAFLMAD